MKTTLPKIVLWAAAMLMLTALTAIADSFPHPKVDFEADLTMTLNQGNGGTQPYVIKGRIHASDGHERREISHVGRTTAILKHRDKEETYTLMPAQKTYTVNTGRDRRDPQRMIQDGDLTITKVGKEKKNGHNTVKYKIASTGNTQNAFDGFAWFTRENIPVLIIGTARDGDKTNQVHIAYDNIRKKKQPARLFEIPSDYRALNTGMPTLPAGMGGGKGQLPPGLTPEQMEQLKKYMQRKGGG